MWVAPRHKGHGTDRQLLPLSPQAVAALREFDTLDCWGSFSNGSVWKTFKRACKRANVQLRPAVRSTPQLRLEGLRHDGRSAGRAIAADAQLAENDRTLHTERGATETQARRSEFRTGCPAGKTWQRIVAVRREDRKHRINTARARSSGG